MPHANGDGTMGWIRSGPVKLPAGMVAPGAVRMRKMKHAPALLDDDGKPIIEKDYIGEIKLVSVSSHLTLPVNSWVSPEQGWRLFFVSAACLPSKTEDGLKKWRTEELKALQGTPETRTQERQPSDRIYWYQTYNDLGVKTDKVTIVRPTLGGSKDLPYPRRIATNRGNDDNGHELPPPAGEAPWLPFDEMFSYYKGADFSGGKNGAAVRAILAVIAEAGENNNLNLLNVLPTGLLAVIRLIIARAFGGSVQDVVQYDNYADVIKMYKLTDKGDEDDQAAAFKALLPQKDMGFGATASTTQSTQSTEGTTVAAHDHTHDKPTLYVQACAAAKKAIQSFQEFTGNVSDEFFFPVPKVLANRPDAWYTDEEYGRQAVAGFNPCVLKALKELPKTFGSAISNEHVFDDLQGASLEQLVAEAAAGQKPRLYLIDYWGLGHYWHDSSAAAANGNGNASGAAPKAVQHAGRALFYLKKDAAGNDSALIPVAIELAHDETHKDGTIPRTAGVVYSRSSLAGDLTTAPVWRLAKAVFKSLDESYHQLISHWLRTHAVLEPFHIAMRRQLSTMHPVYHLMVPHFRYTLSINNNARASLINAGGVIENTFSAGEYAMRLSSVVYGASWTFKGQALTQDLKDRGMVDASGKPWLDYPYAEDGLQLWGALDDYFKLYLPLYYGTDGDVLDDTELQAWWQEVKTEGHPDLVALCGKPEAEVWGFSGPIPSVEKLRHVLVTVAWLASAHHAAVNFGQYDYTGMPLNASSLIRRRMPVEGSKEYKALTGADSSKAREKELLSYLTDPISAAQVVATVRLLSTHMEDEQTLDEKNSYLVRPEAQAANRKFIKAMQQLERDIESRNTDPSKWARNCLAPKPAIGAAPLPYTLLMPSSPPGVTMRGVPYSVSI